jgi:ribonuclease PH
MEAAILLHLYPKSKIEIIVWVLADDGGRLSAAINATTLALINAGIPIKDMVCACSAGIGSGGVTLVDLNKREESSSGGQPAVHLPCAMLPQRGTVVLAQCEARLSGVGELENVSAAAMEGCRAVATTAAGSHPRACCLTLEGTRRTSVDYCKQFRSIFYFLRFGRVICNAAKSKLPYISS